MTAKYRVYYVDDSGRQEHLDGECYAEIRATEADATLRARGFHFYFGTNLYSASAKTIALRERLGRISVD